MTQTLLAQYEPLYQRLAHTQLNGWIEPLRRLTESGLQPDAHGKMEAWQEAISRLPHHIPDKIDLKNKVDIGNGDALSSAEQADLVAQLQVLHPWRKGPFSLFGIDIDTEWRSDWKWGRLERHISPLNGRKILDIGSGNGYYGWRMLGHGARWVLGLDPFPVYVMQYHAFKRYLPAHANWVVPLGVEQLPAGSRLFDTLFSMGVLYHRRSPFDHLISCRDTLRSGGEFVLETLVIDGKAGEVLVPEKRYAQMRNVWFIPSCLTLESWLRKAQFKEIRLIDVTATTTEEQRATNWMRFHSLANFLDPADPTRTVEGHPAPVRAIMIATAP